MCSLKISPTIPLTLLPAMTCWSPAPSQFRVFLMLPALEAQTPEYLHISYPFRGDTPKGNTSLSLYGHLPHQLSFKVDYPLNIQKIQ